MGVRVLVVGEHGSGRTALCGALELYLRKRGQSTAVANLDPCCKRLVLDAAYDVRAHARDSWDGADTATIEKELLNLAQDYAFLDFGPSLADALLNDNVAVMLAKASDKVLFVVDATKARGPWLESLRSSVEERLGKQVFLVLNKSDLVKEHPLYVEKRAKGFEASAKEGKGLKELAEALAATE